MTTDEEKARLIQLLAARIKSIRLKSGHTNYENFAFDNEIGRAQYGRYERGTDIRFTSLVKVVKAFNMTLEEFFSEGFDELKD
ncbi:MAG: helix-turn-helix transcriptional regulator [Flavobacteriales bacterium]|nr:helix-turn-helix transcriptional regulator [Flavobacteriales bacterium]